MTSTAPRQPKVNAVGDEFIRFRVPNSILGSIKVDGSNRTAKMTKIASIVDGEALPFVGVPLSGLIIRSVDSDLNFGPHMFKSKTGKTCLIYSSGESPSGFYLRITKLTPKNAAMLKDSYTLVEPKKFQ